MSSFDLNQASIEEEEHDLRVPNHFLTTLYHQYSSYYNCITFSQHQQHEHKEILFMAGSSCNDHSCLIAPDPANKSHRDDLKLSLCDPFSSFKREKEEEGGIRESSWMPSKMRLMRKMMKYSTTHMIVSKPSSRTQDEIQPDHRGFPLKNNITRKNNNDINSILSSDIIRVCSDCNTTKTPLWRSGPCGPKSLCNACGIRQRKARRAMATALNGVGMTNDGGGHATTTTTTMTMTNKIRKEKKLGIDRTDLPFKKRCKMNIGTPPHPPPPPENISFEDATILLTSDKHNSSSTVSQKVFPQDQERDAAILLMALSCSIIRS